jgi:hypothetical protein
MSVITPSRRALSMGLFAAAVLPAGGADAQERRPPRVDLLLPLSGPTREVVSEARDIADAARLALDDYAAGARSPAALAVSDTGGDAMAAAATASAARAGGSRLILGPLFAREAEAVGRAVPDLPVVTFSNDRAIGRRGVYVFGFQPETEARVLALHARRAGFGPLSVFGPAGPLHARVRAALAGIDPGVVSTAYAPGASLAQAARRHVAGLIEREARVTPVVFLATAPEQAADAAEALQAASQANGALQIAGGSALGEAAARDPRRLAGSLYAAADPRARRGFESRFQRRFGRPPGRLAGLGYDGAYLGAVLAAEGRLTVPEVERRNGFLGVDGLFRFAGDGVVERALAVVQATPAGPYVVAPAPRAF